MADEIGQVTPVSPVNVPRPYVTLEDIRLFMIDKRPEDNYLLDDLEFTNEEITSAMNLAIDKFNSISPTIVYYTAQTFPFRYQLIEGTAAILLRMRAINLTRNRLNYQSQGGTAVQDKDRAPEYLALAKLLMEDFERESRDLKKNMNTEACYGTLLSRYSTLRRI
jgi:hypothetical protein